MYHFKDLYHASKAISHCVLVFVLLLSTTAFGQTLEKISFGDQNPDDYYLLLRPRGEEIKGVLVLLPGFGEVPESIFPESMLFNVAYGNGILTMAIAEGQKLYADEPVVDKLNRGLSHLLKSFPMLDKTKFVIGGYSAGGTVAMRYVEYCHTSPKLFPIQPRGVFAVDSPLDLFNIWNYFQREIEKNYSEAGTFEAKFVTGIMKKEIGAPQDNPTRYEELTPININKNASGNEQALKNVAVRVYEDTDIEWQLRERRRSYFDTNQLVAAELINRLLLMGNKKAEFMSAKTPGYRSTYQRHPHSWSIVDEIELIHWMSGIME